MTYVRIAAVGSAPFEKRTVLFAAAAFLWWCCSLASADDSAVGRLFPVGVRFEYEFRSSVLVDGPSRLARNGTTSPAGHRVVGRLSVSSIWSDPSDGKLLRLHVSRQTHLHLVRFRPVRKLTVFRRMEELL
jgi:hypothetical protein